jgi:hypothetical protein
VRFILHTIRNPPQERSAVLIPPRLRRLLLAPLALAAIGGCDRSAPPMEELRTTPVRAGESVVSAPFGGTVQGRPLWLSRGGRVALLYRLDADTDGNGRLEASFGFHGETLADQPRLWAYDLERGTETRYDELLTIDPTDRYAALRRDGRYLLLDGRTGAVTDLSAWGISGPDDANRCLPPRQLSFDEAGRRIAFLRGSPPRLVVREIESGAEREIEPDSGLLWRGGFGPFAGWMQMDVVDAAAGDGAAFPEQFTSCHSRAAVPFASSYSFGGWDGPPFRSVLVPRRGRRVTIPGEALPVGPRAYALADTALRRANGRPVPLPSGCMMEMTVFPGAPTVLLECRRRSVLFNPASGRSTPLPVRLFTDEVTAAVDDDGRHWAAVLVDIGAPSRTTDRAPEYRLARLRLEDGLIQAGPRVQDFQLTGGHWAVTGRYALDLRTGTLLEVGQSRAAIQGGLAWDATRPVKMIALEQARSFPVGPAAGAPSPDGCVIEGTERVPHAPLQRGPWRRRCLKVGGGG